MRRSERGNLAAGRRGLMTTITLPAVEVEGTLLETDCGKLRVPGCSLRERTIQLDDQLVFELVAAARTAAQSAYAPFSRFQVGAALVMQDDPGETIICGSNVENSSYGGTICAERAAIFNASGRGLRRIRFLVVSTVATLGETLSERSPCGLCRQVIREFADQQTLVICDSGEEDTLGDIFDIERLLPFGFQFSPSQAD